MRHQILYLKYYIISGAIITFSIASFFIRKDIKINITLFVASTIFVLYLIEGFLDVSQFLFEKQYLEKMIFDCLIPVLELNSEDNELWSMYPKEYLLRDKQESDIENDPRSIVNAMIITVSQY